MKIRQVESRDRDDWVRMRSALWPDAAKDDLGHEVDAHLAGISLGAPDLQAVFVAESDERTVGFLELSVREYAEGCDGPTPYIEGWYVDADHRRAGVGGALVASAEAWARGRGFGAIASDAELPNDTSLRAHRALGYEEVERVAFFRKTLSPD